MDLLLHAFRVISGGDELTLCMVQSIYTCMPPIHALASYDVMMSVIAPTSDKG